MTRYVQRAQGSVRIGPVSIFALVIIMCLSVMAVLASATAHANVNEAQKQADFTIGTYANETAAQEFVAQIDGVLAQTKAQGGDKEAAMAAIKAILPAEARISGNVISLAFVATDGRCLTASLEIHDDLTYQITRWKVTTQWNLDDSETTLWTGQ